jgi:hypothetical protein
MIAYQVIKQIVDSWRNYFDEPDMAASFPFGAPLIRKAINSWAEYSGTDYRVLSALDRVTMRRNILFIQKLFRDVLRENMMDGNVVFNDGIEAGIDDFKQQIETMKDRGAIADYSIDMESNDEEVRRIRLNMVFAPAVEEIKVTFDIHRNPEE